MKLITVDEISYFQADNKYTRVVTGEGEALIRKPLKELVDELDPNQFWQILAQRWSMQRQSPASRAIFVGECW